jgi:hypothetical protein
VATPREQQQQQQPQGGGQGGLRRRTGVSMALALVLLAAAVLSANVPRVGDGGSQSVAHTCSRLTFWPSSVANRCKRVLQLPQPPQPTIE